MTAIILVTWSMLKHSFSTSSSDMRFEIAPYVVPEGGRGAQNTQIVGENVRRSDLKEEEKGEEKEEKQIKVDL